MEEGWEDHSSEGTRGWMAGPSWSTSFFAHRGHLVWMTRVFTFTSGEQGDRGGRQKGKGEGVQLLSLFKEGFPVVT